MSTISYILYEKNNQTYVDIRNIIYAVNNDFIPPLEKRIDIEEYSRKLSEKAINFSYLTIHIGLCLL